MGGNGEKLRMRAYRLANETRMRKRKAPASDAKSVIRLGLCVRLFGFGPTASQ